VRPLASFLLATALAAHAAQLEVREFTSAKLRGNPLGDPATRRIAILSPDGVKGGAPLPLVIYLPGWGSSSEDAIAQGRGSLFGKVVDELAAAKLPVQIAVVDGRSRFGGSQFLNSTATGDYADYVSEEIVPLLAKPKRPATMIAGHSSGAYGALMLAMSRHELFDGVIALSPDSDFETTHKPLAEEPAVRRVTRAELDAAMAPTKSARLPGDGLAALMMGLCANYVPTAGAPGRFDWLYDDLGQWRADVWQRWIARDPLTKVRENAAAFSPAQRIYLDGAEHDEFGANIGARKIHAVLREQKSPATFYESPGQHSDRLGERLVRGLRWFFGKS
jgi:S-formylglutathione hydrolase FrmB